MVAFSPYYQFLYFFFNINQTQKRFGTTYNLHLVMIDQSNLKKKSRSKCLGERIAKYNAKKCLDNSIDRSSSNFSESFFLFTRGSL